MEMNVFLQQNEMYKRNFGFSKMIVIGRRARA
jgi:hypothetical protein